MEASFASNGVHMSDSSDEDDDIGQQGGDDGFPACKFAFPIAATLIHACADEPDWRTPGERVKEKVEGIREKHASKVDPGGRKNGGNRTADNILKAQFLFNEQHLEDTLEYDCGCGDWCCSMFDVESVRMLRSQTYFWKPNTERSTKLFEDLYSRLEYNPVDDTVTLHYWILRVEVCQEAYFHLRLGGVHPSQRKRILAPLLEGATQFKANYKEFHTQQLRLHGLKRDDTIREILFMCHIFGDEQPDDEGEYQELHLDPGISKGWLYYNEYLDKCMEKVTDPASYSYFVHIWNTVFVRGSTTEVNGVKYVIKLRDENRKKRFHECAFCAGKKRALTTLPPEAVADKALIREQLLDHYVKEVKVEKQGYYGRRAEGRETMRNAHDGALSIIMDGADKSDHQYPHQPRLPETLQNVTRMKIKMQGVLIHGLCLLLYMIPPWLGSGGGMAITCLLHSIWMAKNLLGSLPSKLYLQSDNGSENKNKAMLHVLHLLVHFRVFQEVHWNLLIPGHTDEDIDGWFSVISRWLVKVFIISLSELCKRLPSAFTQTLVSVHLIWCTCLFDTKVCCCSVGEVVGADGWCVGVCHQAQHPGHQELQPNAQHQSCQEQQGKNSLLVQTMVKAQGVEAIPQRCRR